MAQPANMMSPIAAMMGPDVAKQQYELQQNQRYADILMQQALQEQPQGQMVSGHYVPPSPVQGLAQLLKAYVGRRASDLVPEKQASLAAAQQQQVQNMFGLGGGTTQPQARDMALTGGAMQGDVGPTNTNAQRMSGVQTGSGSAMPIPAGMSPQTAMMQYMINPQAYATALGTHSSPTERQKNIAALFPVGSPQYRAAMQGGLTKDNYIAPTVVGEGGSLVQPGANRPSFIAPKNGIQINPATGQSTVLPGYANAVGTISLQDELGKGTGKALTAPATKIDLNTGNTVGTTQADTMGLNPNPFATQNTQSGQSTAPVVTQVNPVMTAIETGNNEDWRKNVFAPAITQGQTAKSTLDSVAVLRNTNLQTGFGTETKANIANMLASVGVKGAEKFATNAQIFQKEGSKALLDRLATQKGSQTERDAITGRETFAALSDTPQAKDFTLDLAQAMATQDQRKAQYFQKAANMPQVHKGKLGTISNEWSKVEGSTFDVPIGMGADGKPITMRQKYGIK